MVDKNEQVHDGGQSLVYYWNRCSGCQLQDEQIEVGWKGNLERAVKEDRTEEKAFKLRRRIGKECPRWVELPVQRP